ncbi:c-type cytochrome [Rhizobium sp. YS-1r]|uniref:c-type cytochrome n=1 Tax=Rhizobium sp. YS-1r TaxID=1532558 RepID=UPI00068BD826|nr:c-type cytochrome [Rhizobium sp. YS-1r]
MKRSNRHATIFGAALATMLCAAVPTLAADLFAAGQFNDYEPDLANGETLFHASSCASCHGVDGDPTILGGGMRIETKFGNLYAPNITEDSEAGVGGWSNSDYLNAVIHGTSPEGDSYYGVAFPYAFYSRMKPEDVLDIRGYIATLPKSDAGSRPHEVNFLNARLLKLWSTESVALPPPQQNAQMARGQYLVEGAGHCAQCHTPRKAGFGLSHEFDEARPFEGETGIFGDYAPDISAARLAEYEPQEFIVGVLAEAHKLRGSPMARASMRRIAAETAQLSLDDRAAIYAYLSGKFVDVATITDKAAAVPVVVADAQPAAGSDATGQGAAGSGDLQQRIAAFCSAETASAAASAVRPAAKLSTAVDPELASRADSVIDKHCRSCHGPGTTYQKSFLTGDLADMARDGDVVVPGDPDASRLYESIAGNRMPIGQKMTPEELTTLADWIRQLGQDRPAEAAAAAPTRSEPQAAAILPRFIGGPPAELHLAALQDMNGLREADRVFTRYFSLAEFPLPPVDCADIDNANPVHAFHAALNKFVNSVSRAQSLSKVEPVAGTDGALVRIDIRNYGWTGEDWQALTRGVYTRGAEAAGFTADAWARLARRYPYAVDPQTDPLLKAIATSADDLVPIMRADWFVRFASEAPYYDMLLRLPPQIADLESRLGINADHNIRSMRVERAGFSAGASGVSDHNRMLERHELGAGGYYWKSYDFAGSSERQSLLAHPDGPAWISPTPSRTKAFEHDGGEMIFSLANGMQGYYLSTAAGDRLLVGPTSIVSFRKKEIGKGVDIVNARSCFDCHENGIISKRDEVRRFVETSTLFDRDQRDILLQLYPDQATIDARYKQDSDRFITALTALDAVQPSAAGRPVSLQAPTSAGGGEIVTFMADRFFDNLDLDMVSREFGLDPQTFRERAISLGDPVLYQVVADWLSKFDGGLLLTREQYEEYWAALLPRLTDVAPLQAHEVAFVHDDVATAGSDDDLVEQAFAAITKKASAPFTPAATEAYRPMQAPAKASGALRLELSVPEVKVHVNDLLTFSVSANRRCELQILYVEVNKNIEELPAGVLGPVFLEAGERRQIPYPGSGLQLRFDEPGLGETMLAFCKEGGLGADRLSAHQALKFAREHFQPLKRGLIIEAAEKAARPAGDSALNAVTFDVR